MRVAAVLGVLLLAAVSGCGGDDGSRRTLDVLAAASLTDPFEQLAEEFEDDHPDVDVRLSFGSSAALARQVVEGAPADVLATADLTTMQVAVDGGAVEDPTPFATNRMVLVTPADGSPVDDVADLDRADVTYVACVDSAPCGAVAARLLERNDVEHEPVSLEPDVKAVLTKVLTGEVDAGLVYASDAEAATGQVEPVAVPGSAADVNVLAMAVTAQAEPQLAQAWESLVVGARGQQVLRTAGFEDAPGMAGGAG